MRKRVEKDKEGQTHVDPRGGYEVVAIAREAELTVDTSHNEVIVHMWNGIALSESAPDSGTHDSIRFENKEWNVPLQDLQHTAPLSWRDMRWGELMEARQQQTQAIANQSAVIAMLMAQVNLVNPPLDLPQNIKNNESVLKREAGKLNGINTEIQMRPALAFGCLFFVLVGCPVGIWFSRSDYLSAFITCFLPIVFVYYPLQLCSTNLAKDGKVDPMLALWTANAVMGVMALFLFRRLVKN
jgi:lipopolysaccharide export system permease protein